MQAKEINSARSEFSADIAKIEAQDCHARYSLDYLQKFIKAGKQFETTSLNFANDPNPKTEALPIDTLIFSTSTFFTSQHVKLSFTPSNHKSSNHNN